MTAITSATEEEEDVARRLSLPVRLVNARVTYKNAPIHLLEKFTFKDIESAHRLFWKPAPRNA